MLATAAVISLVAMIGVVQKVQSKLDGRSEQSICLANIQSEFDRHIATLIVASVDKNALIVDAEKENLRAISHRFESLSLECPNP